MVFTPTAEFIFDEAREIEIERQDGETWLVKSSRLERHVLMTNFDHRDSVRRFQGIMRKIGVDDLLREAGAKPGHTVIIGEMEFVFADYDDGQEY